MMVLDLETLLPPTIQRCFEAMGVAEDALAKVKHPPEGAFLALTPPEGMLSMRQEVYRSHVEELAERMCSGKSLSRPTESEMLVTLHMATLKAPLKSGPALAYIRLFENVVGECPFEPEVRPHEAYPGEIDEIILEMQRKTIKRGGA